MRYFLLLIFPFIVKAQTTDLSLLNTLETNEQVVINISEGGCFYGETQKILIFKKENLYEYVYIENVYKIIYKIVDKAILLRRDKLKKWISENTEALKKYGKRSVLTEAQYQAKIESLEGIIHNYTKCTSRFAGDYSRIEIHSDKLKLNKRFSCKIAGHLLRLIFEENNTNKKP